MFVQLRESSSRPCKGSRCTAPPLKMPPIKMQNLGHRVSLTWPTNDSLLEVLEILKTPIASNISPTSFQSVDTCHPHSSVKLQSQSFDCKNRAVRLRKARFSGDHLGDCQVRLLFLGIPVRDHLSLKESMNFTNTPSKSTCLYTSPSLHTVNFTSSIRRCLGRPPSGSLASSCFTCFTFSPWRSKRSNKKTKNAKTVTQPDHCWRTIF